MLKITTILLLFLLFSFFFCVIIGASLKLLAKLLLKPFLPSGTIKQANKMSLIESALFITGKNELAWYFNSYFVHIIDYVPDRKEHYFENYFSPHPSIRATVEENSNKIATHFRLKI